MVTLTRVRLRFRSRFRFMFRGGRRFQNTAAVIMTGGKGATL